MEFNRMKEFEKMLKQLEKNVQKLSGTHEVSFDELFTDSFMRKYTNFMTSSSFFEYCDILTDEDFAAKPDEDLDLHVSLETEFDSWEEMQTKAAEEYVTKGLGF